MRPIHVGIDSVGIRDGGSGQVLVDILSALNRHRDIGRITLFCLPSNRLEFILPSLSKMDLCEVSDSTNSAIGRIKWLNRDLKRKLISLGCDLFLAMNGMGNPGPSLPTVAFIQQALPFYAESVRLPFAYRFRMAIIRYHMKKCAKRAQTIIVQTPTMKARVIDQFGLIREAIVVCLPTAPPLPEEDTFPNRFFPLVNAPEGRRLLYVGSIYPYKNLSTVLEGLPYIQEKTPDTKMFQICPSTFSPNLKGLDNLGACSRGELRKAYELATVLIMPSLCETVGLPMLEAMEVGTPVLAANRSYARDVCGDSAIYFNPLSPRDFAEKALKLILDKGLRLDLEKKGRMRSLFLSERRPYDKMANTLVEASWRADRALRSFVK